MSIGSEARRVVRGMQILHKGYAFSKMRLGRELGMSVPTVRRMLAGDHVSMPLERWIALERVVSRLLDRCRVNLCRQLERARYRKDGILSVGIRDTREYPVEVGRFEAGGLEDGDAP